MDPPVAGELPAVVVGGVLTADVACRRCSYNLRGLRDDGLCPECATPISLSTRLPLLRFADPEWLNKVVRGLTIILWMILVGLLVGFLAIVLEQADLKELGQLAGLAAGLVSFYGVWLMTTPDPSGIGEDPNITARKVVRFTLAVGLIAQALQILAVNAPPGRVLAWLLWGLIGAGMLLALVGEFAKFIFYEKLARRIPDRTLAGRARFLRWAWTITFAVTTLIGFVAALAVAVAAAPAPGAMSGATTVVASLMCLLLPAGLAFLVFAVMTIFLLIRLRRAIFEQAVVARATWAMAAGPPPT